MKILLLLSFISFVLVACPSDEFLGEKSLCIENHSGKQIFFWFSYDFEHYHYPDTILPIEKPFEIRGAGSGGCVGNSVGQNPYWQTVFSKLPADKFTVYFFETDIYPETQEDWDELRNNMEELVERKDVTFEELKANDYVIEYP